jgi:hypothetical protein
MSNFKRPMTTLSLECPDRQADELSLLPVLPIRQAIQALENARYKVPGQRPFIGVWSMVLYYDGRPTKRREAIVNTTRKAATLN